MFSNNYIQNSRYFKMKMFVSKIIHSSDWFYLEVVWMVWVNSTIYGAPTSFSYNLVSTLVEYISYLKFGYRTFSKPTIT